MSERLPELLPDVMELIDHMNRSLDTIEGGAAMRKRLDRLLRRMRTGEGVVLHGQDRRLLVVTGSFFACALDAWEEGYQLALSERPS